MIDGILLDRLDNLDNEIDTLDYKIKTLMECGQSPLDETIKKTTLLIRRDEIIDLIEEYQRQS